MAIRNRGATTGMTIRAGALHLGRAIIIGETLDTN